MRRAFARLTAGASAWSGSLPALEPTHPGGVVDEHATGKGWRLGVAASWRALEHRGCAACRQLVEELGNSGPPPTLGRTVD